MADFMGLMKQAAQLQSKVQAMQAELEKVEVEGAAGGGLLTLRLNGKGELKAVNIDSSLLKPDAPQDRSPDAGQDEGAHRRTTAAARIEAVLRDTSHPHGEEGWPSGNPECDGARRLLGLRLAVTDA